MGNKRPNASGEIKRVMEEFELNGNAGLHSGRQKAEIVFKKPPGSSECGSGSCIFERAAAAFTGKEAFAFLGWTAGAQGEDRADVS